MFEELAALTSIAQRIATCDDVEVPSWRFLYDLYRTIETLAHRAEDAARLLAPDQGTDNAEFRLDDADWPRAVNDVLAEIDDLARGLVNTYRSRALGINSPIGLRISDQALAHIIRCHFHPKSLWFMEFFSHWTVGKVSPDGQKLFIHTLRLEGDPVYRLQNFDDDKLIRAETLSLSPPVRAWLSTEAASHASVMAQHAAAVGALLRLRCTVEDLL